ncbi:MAG: hypothetical protein JXR71_02670 [Bacteroidales bacterium]|nr:hypothetical protein [Bacteroidales bacterium]
MNRGKLILLVIKQNIDPGELNHLIIECFLHPAELKQKGMKRKKDQAEVKQLETTGHCKK